MSKKFLIHIKVDYIKRFEQGLKCSKEEIIETFEEDFGMDHIKENKFVATETDLEKYLYTDEYKIIKEMNSRKVYKD